MQDETVRHEAVPQVHAVPAAVLILTSAAVLLALVGGLVPGLAQQVNAGRLPAAFGPEHHLGPPSSGSISGRSALLGALWWTAIALVGLALRLFRLRRGTVALAIALALTLLINVMLPLGPTTAGWSILGVLQTLAMAAAVGSLARHDLPSAIH